MTGRLMRCMTLAAGLFWGAALGQNDPSAAKNGHAERVIDGADRGEGASGKQEVTVPVESPPGTTARVVAGHADLGVTSPTALAFDEQGNLFVSETHRFRRGVEDDRDRTFWFLDDLASMKVEDRRKMLEKWKDEVSPEYMTEYSEVIRRLSGAGEDGVFTKSQVFAEGLNDALDGTAAGVFAYDGVIYLACIPKIHTYRDTDGDGVSDRHSVMQDGFGVRFSLSGHDMNGFKLGADGRIYGTIGDRGFNLVTREGVAYEHPDEGAVFRFDPDGSNFEIFHRGLRNPKELAFDEFGNLFSVDNNSDQGDEARLVYVVDGGDSGWRMEHQAMHTFHRQIGLKERPLGRWMAEKMWQPANEDQPGFLLPPVANLTSGPSGLAYHPGTGFLESEVGRFLVCDYRGSAAKSGIHSFAVKPSGGGMKLQDTRWFSQGTAVTDLTYSWDGRLLVSDFIGGWASHDGGRIYEVRADDPYRTEDAREVATLVAEGFDQRSSEELFALLGHADMRVRTRAQLALTRKAEGMMFLSKAATEGEGLARFHGIWGLGVMARRGPAAKAALEADHFVELPSKRIRERAATILLPLLQNGDPEVRAQTIKVLGESGVVGEKINFGALFQDSSARVRMYAAIAAGRSRAMGSMSFLWEMVTTNDNQDPYLRHAGAYAMQMMSKPRQLQMLSQHPSAALRLAAVIALGRMESEYVEWFLKDADPRVAAEALRMVHDRGIEKIRPGVAALLDDANDRAWTEMLWMRAIHSAYRLGDSTNAERVLKVALDPKVPLLVRKEALRLMAEWNKPHEVDQSRGQFAPLPERDAGVARGVLEPKLEALLGIEPELLESALIVIERHALDASAKHEQMLKTMILADSLPGGVRAKALDLYLTSDDGKGASFLVELAGSDSGELAVGALRRLVKGGMPEAVPAVGRALESKLSMVRQNAWLLAVGLKGEPVEALFVSGLDGLTGSLGRSSEAIELLESARARPEPAVKQAVARFDEAVKTSSDPLAPWLASLEGGDARRGAQLFKSHPGGQCMRCHRAEAGHGEGEIGPVLAGVASRGDRRFLLESLTLPGAKVAAGYGVISLTLKDGEVVGGLLMDESDDQVVIEISGQQRTIPLQEIQKRSEALSAMPPAGSMLNPRELRDLVEWLSQRKEEKE